MPEHLETLNIKRRILTFFFFTAACSSESGSVGKCLAALYMWSSCLRRRQNKIAVRQKVCHPIKSFSLGSVSYQAEQSRLPVPVKEWAGKRGEILFVNHTAETLSLSGDSVYFVLPPLSYPVDTARRWCVSLM